MHLTSYSGCLTVLVNHFCHIRDVTPVWKMSSAIIGCSMCMAGRVRIRDFYMSLFCAGNQLLRSTNSHWGHTGMYQKSMKNELHQGRANSHSYKLKMTSPCSILFKSQTRPIWLLKLEWLLASPPPPPPMPPPTSAPPPPSAPLPLLQHPILNFACVWGLWTPSTRV